jgi:hypothetical protein
METDKTRNEIADEVRAAKILIELKNCEKCPDYIENKKDHCTGCEKKKKDLIRDIVYKLIEKKIIKQCDKHVKVFNNLEIGDVLPKGENNK